MILLSLLGMVMGILSGLGLGGGKLLIPALVLFTPISQLSAQGITLISFIPIAMVALITHFREKNVNVHLLFWIGLGSMFGAFIGSWLAVGPTLPYLSKIFAGFIILLGVFEFFVPDRK
ncbi:sulfite exporter TauE/SafE family protein [Microaerobacter geothermalis]|uniref:sulfite exporter TauE/SafE family protein n=1 Tax=Microaerobacter geothermalis TaxID=674972 RepID=UPI001F386BE0|nr:sulfite exporter TauE/SafE family protein [Microaerobacter geothermalis]